VLELVAESVSPESQANFVQNNPFSQVITIKHYLFSVNILPV